jgi:hypothetical protein
MQLHAHAADYADAFAEIDLRVAGRMDERDEYLARNPSPPCSRRRSHVRSAAVRKYSRSLRIRQHK